MNTLGTRLKEAREAKGYTQKSVADRFGLTNVAISGYERGARDPDTVILSKMAELYEVSIDWILGRTNNPEEVLSEPSRALVDMLKVELSDEEIMNKIDFTVDGQELPPQMIKDFLAYVRIQRAQQKH